MCRIIPIFLIVTITLLFGRFFFVYGQDLTWTDRSQHYNLADGIRLFQGEQTTPMLKAWYLDVDMTNPGIVLWPYLSDLPAGVEGVADFSKRVGAIAAINGGYFGGSTSYSAVVHPTEVLAQNIAAVTRSGVSYPVTRSFFGVLQERQMSIDWIYHFGNRIDDIYTFAPPLPNRNGSPAAVPTKTEGSQYQNLWAGIGGGPVLIKKGEIHITYDQEVFWESGIGYETRNPRTAVGYTTDHHAILLVVDGRQSASVGASLPELAQIMLKLNCVAAMNLDGGGSTQMAVGSTLINRPEGGTAMRPVPSILAVVYTDSIPGANEDFFEKIIDTEDDACTLVGPGWFASANAGYWGETKAMLNTKGDGTTYARFKTELRPAAYEVYAWWVAANNRCTDTPIIIMTENSSDTVLVNQTKNGSKWNLLGKFNFTGAATDAVIISNAAKNGTYIVADAIRCISYDSTTATGDFDYHAGSPDDFILGQNYPNPFNAVTKINYFIPHQANVKLDVFNVLGEKVTVIVDGEKANGYYEVLFNGTTLPGGVYFYRLSAGKNTVIQKMLMIK